MQSKAGSYGWFDRTAICLVVFVTLMIAIGATLTSCTCGDDAPPPEPVEAPRADIPDAASDIVVGSEEETINDEREQQEAYEDWMYQQNVAADLAATSGA